MKHGALIAIAAAVVIGAILVFASKNTGQSPTIIRTVQPGSTLQSGIAGIISSVGPDLENLIGVTPQGSPAGYGGVYTPPGTVPINGGGANLPENTLILSSGGGAIGGLGSLPDYGSTLFDDGSEGGDGFESFA